MPPLVYLGGLEDCFLNHEATEVTMIMTSQEVMAAQLALDVEAALQLVLVVPKRRPLQWAA